MARTENKLQQRFPTLYHYFFVRLKIEWFVEIQVVLTLKHIQKSQPPLNDNVYISLFSNWVCFAFTPSDCRQCETYQTISKPIREASFRVSCFPFRHQLLYFVDLSSIKPEGQCTMMIKSLFIGIKTVTHC